MLLRRAAAAAVPRSSAQSPVLSASSSLQRISSAASSVAAPIAASSAVSARPFGSLADMGEKLMIRVPKGFGGKPKNAEEAAASSSSEGAAKKENSSSASGGGNGSKKEQEPKKEDKKDDKKEDSSKDDKGKKKGLKPEDEAAKKQQDLITGVLGGAVLTYVLYQLFIKPQGPGGDAGPEISWQEFRNTFLATGMVDRIEVVNREYVKVYMRRTPAPAFLQAAAAEGMTGNGSPKPSSSSASGSRTGFDAAAFDAAASASGGASGADVLGIINLPPEREAELRRAMQMAKARTGPYSFRIGSVDSFERQLEDAQIDIGIRPRDFVLVRHTTEAERFGGLMSVLPTLFLIGLYIMIARSMFGGGGLGGGLGGGGMGGMGGGGRDGISRVFGIGKAKPTIVNKDTKVKVTFKDVAGADEAKAEVMEFVQFLKDPSKFTNLGAKIPKGALLVGPPGTGKTLLAKATAGEAGVPFFSMSGSDFIEMFVGVGPSRVRDLFQQARQAAPCMIFIDEIDAVARARNKGGFSGGNDERENTLNQLLVEMDGFSTTEGVVVLAGTNRADILDKAILRPGRFDRQIQVDKPDIKGRRDIFLVHMKAIKLAGQADSYAQRLAALTPGFVGADIHNICNEAAIVAARKNKDSVDMKDFESAIDRVIGGLERRNALMSPEEKKTIAYHEAGHAIAGWFLEHADPLLKVTIIPRGSGALGFAQYLPKEVALYTREALFDRMCMALGGRAAEDLMFEGRITTGASDDLDKVTQMAYAMTTIYGMNAKIGTISFPKREENQFEKPYSDATATVIDEEVKKLVDEAYVRTKSLLGVHKEKLRGVAELLLSRETINQNDLATIAGPRPWPINPKLKEYIDTMFEELHSDAADDDKSKKKDGDDGNSGSSGSGGSGGGEAAEGSEKKAEDKKDEKEKEDDSAAARQDKMSSSISISSAAASTLRAIANTLERGPAVASASAPAASLGDRAVALLRSWRGQKSQQQLQEEAEAEAAFAKLRPAYLVNDRQRQLR